MSYSQLALEFEKKKSTGRSESLVTVPKSNDNNKIISHTKHMY